MKPHREEITCAAPQIIKRMAVSPAEYASPVQVFQRRARRIPEALLTGIACILIGAAMGILLAWRG